MAISRGARELMGVYNAHYMTSLRPLHLQYPTIYSIIIDAKESRNVATADVVGSYLNADMEDFTLMKLTGEAVGSMIQVNMSYKFFVTKEKGKVVLYLQLKKALYGYGIMV
jgi:hypothetical protein